MYGVLGNHDLKEFCEKTILHNCHFEVLRRKDLSFLGVQGVACGEKRYKNVERRRWYHWIEDEIVTRLFQMPKVTFFVTHYRAKNIFDAYKEGSPAFRKYIEREKPMYYFSGHTKYPDMIHQVGEDGTLCINPHASGWDYVILEGEPRKFKVSFMKKEDVVEVYKE